MKLLKIFVAAILALAAALTGGCSDDDGIDNRDLDYGYVQFKLYKEASYDAVSRAQKPQLDYLYEAAKVQVSLGCNGTTVTCPGGLSQWGTVPLAEQGLSAEQILQSFYGNDINFVTGAPLSPNLGGSFPGVTLRLGDFSEDVRTVQTRLNRISTNFPNIPKIYPTDGVEIRLRHAADAGRQF